MDLLTSKETAAYLRMTDGQLRQLRYTRKGPPHIKIGRTVRYDRARVDQWLLDLSGVQS